MTKSEQIIEDYLRDEKGTGYIRNGEIYIETRKDVLTNLITKVLEDEMS